MPARQRQQIKFMNVWALDLTTVRSAPVFGRSSVGYRKPQKSSFDSDLASIAAGVDARTPGEFLFAGELR